MSLQPASAAGNAPMTANRLPRVQIDTPAAPPGAEHKHLMRGRPGNPESKRNHPAPV